MKAWCAEHFGLDGLRQVDLPSPRPGPGEVRVAVKAVSLNASDVEFLVGKPVYTRFFAPRRPPRILGSDIAGEVVAIGPGESSFSVGDRVVADNLYRWGGLAEEACLPADRCVPIPDGVGWIEASALPQAAGVALQATSSIESGQRVLVNGAGGGCGLFCVQLAAARGAEVIGVDQAGKHPSILHHRASACIDYSSRDFADGQEGYDLVIDLIATRTLAHALRAVSPGGTYLLVGGGVPNLLETVMLGWLRGWSTGTHARVLAADEGFQLAELLDRVEVGALSCPVGHVLPMDEADEGLRLLHAGEAMGKVVITP